MESYSPDKICYLNVLVMVYFALRILCVCENKQALNKFLFSTYLYFEETKWLKMTHQMGHLVFSCLIVNYCRSIIHKVSPEQQEHKLLTNF